MDLPTCALSRYSFPAIYYSDPLTLGRSQSVTDSFYDFVHLGLCIHIPIAILSKDKTLSVLECLTQLTISSKKQINTTQPFDKQKEQQS